MSKPTIAELQRQILEKDADHQRELQRSHERHGDAIARATSAESALKPLQEELVRVRKERDDSRHHELEVHRLRGVIEGMERTGAIPHLEVRHEGGDWTASPEMAGRLSREHFRR